MTMEAYQQLEKEWAEWNDLAPEGMVVCSSGTAALHLALEALQLPQGSEVITSDFNMIAVPRAIAMAGLTPVFVDCDELLLMDLDSFERSRNSLSSAIIAVHIYGRHIDMDRVADGRLMIIEDLAEIHGVKPHTQTDAACWSFYKNKIVAGEEGGAVWFRDNDCAKLARQLRSLGFTDAHNFNHIPRGHNYRMSNAHAKLIQHSLALAEPNIQKRRRVEAWYDESCPSQYRMPPRQAPWVYDLRIPDINALQQIQLIRNLHAAGIAARFGFKPMHWQREFSKCRLVCDGLSQASIASLKIIYLPLAPTVTKKDVKKAFDVIACQ